MSCNVPFTNVINGIILLSALMGKQNIFLPVSIGVLCAGTTMAQLYPEGISKKYKKSVSLLRVADLFVHWLPALVLLHTTRRRATPFHVAVSMCVPLMYFSLGFKKDSPPSLKEPFGNMLDTYPNVPRWVFALYVAGALGTPTLQRAYHGSKILHR